MSNYRRLALALTAPMAVLTALPGPAAAQFSESYKFLEAVKKKELTEVNEMLDKGSPNLVNTRDLTSGETALHIVTARRDLPWLDWLISKGAKVNVGNARGVTPLVAATNLNWIEGVELLIANGARVDESNNSGETPLITAVHNRNMPLIRILLKAGADPDRADNSGRSAREYARLANDSSILSVIASDTKPKANAGQSSKVYGPKF